MEDKKQVLPSLPAGSDPLSIEIHNEHRIDPSVRSLLATHLTAHLDANNKISVLVLGGRCGLVAEILLPFSAQMDIVEQQPFAKLLEWRFSQRKEVEYFFGKEGFIGCRHTMPAPVLNGQEVRILRAQNLRSEGRKSYDLIVLQNPIITAESNLIEQLLATEHSLLVTTMVPGKITDPKLFSFFVRFEKRVIPALYTPLGYQSVQDRRQLTGRRDEILYHEVYTFKRKEGQVITEPQLLDLLGKDQQKEVNSENHQNPYESKSMVDTYLAFHYGPSLFGIQNFPKACAEVCINQAKKRGIQGRVLDLGCAVGRSTVQLAQYFTETVGIDFSKAFVDASQKVLDEQYQQLSAKVRFVVGDACNLDPALGKFSLIFGGNLIDRLPDPAAFLSSISNFLQPNGLLILTSPYTWLEQYTHPSKWIGGIIQNGVEISTPDGIGKILTALGVTECRERENLRFVIKVNDWVYEYTLANVTFWHKAS